MTRRVIVRPQAQRELADAADWYDTRDVGLGDALLRGFDEAVQLITRNPPQYQKIVREYRRAPLKGFPYGLIYRVTDDAIVVVSCFHGRRDPKRWHFRTGK